MNDAQIIAEEYEIIRGALLSIVNRFNFDPKSECLTFRGDETRYYADVLNRPEWPNPFVRPAEPNLDHPLVRLIHGDLINLCDRVRNEPDLQCNKEVWRLLVAVVPHLAHNTTKG
jgi:hypothetical protein